MHIKILYEDNHIIAVDKEAGILTQQDSSGVSSLLDFVKAYIKEKYNKAGNVFVGLVHRLDKPASGIVVFARTSKAAQRLHQEFASRQVVKIYIALVENKKLLDQGIWIERNDSLIRKRGYSASTFIPNSGAQSARMKFIILTRNDAFSLILVNLMTGRKHQIRAQLAAMGLPIVGDEKYGSHQSCADNSICLHAIFLSFMHPTKKILIEICSPIPERISEKIMIDDALLKNISSTLQSQVHDLILNE